MYNFTDLTDLQYFVNATWYGDYYKASFMNKTEFNETQFEAFFNTSNNASFGFDLDEVNFANV